MAQPLTPSIRKATTFRLDPSVQEGLELIAKTHKITMNRLVNEALQHFVRRRSAEVSAKLKETLKMLEAHRTKDPDFNWAIEQFVDNEARYAKMDPAEGKTKKPRGPVQARIREILHG